MVRPARILLMSLQQQFRECGSSSSNMSSIRDAVKWLEQYDRGDCRDAYFHLLRRCIDAKAADEGRRLHSLIRRRRYDYDGYLSTLLIRLYSACSATTAARAVYDSLPSASMSALHRMLESYISNNEIDQARSLFDSVEIRDDTAWNIMLQAYTSNGQMQRAEEFFRTAESPAPVDLWITMIKGYSSSRMIEQAREIFRSAPGSERMWSAMISAYADNGDLDAASRMLKRMRNPSVSSCKVLFDAYLQSGRIADAQWAFNRIGDVHEAPWMELLTAYLGRGSIPEARDVFRIMPEKPPDAWNAMIAAYAGRGDLREATDLFEKMGSLKRNLASWNAVMRGYAVHGRGRDAVKIFRGMKDRGVKPNRDSFEVIIQGGGVDPEVAEIVLREVEWSVFVRDVEMNNLVLKMFAGVASVERTRRVFQKMEVRNRESWCVLVGGVSDRGEHEAALEFLSEMVLEGELPERYVFERIVSGCNKVEEVGKCFKLMVDFEVEPGLEDYVSVMKVLKPGESQEVVECMPFEPDGGVWEKLMEVCKAAGDVQRVAVAEKALSDLRLSDLCSENVTDCDATGKKSGEGKKKKVKQSMYEGDGERTSLERRSKQSMYEGDEERSRVVKLEKRAKRRGEEARLDCDKQGEQSGFREAAGEERQRMVKLEERAKRSMHEEARPGMVFRTPGLDLEKFWIGE